MFCRALLVTLAIYSTASAAVTAIDVSERSDVLEGKSFGSAGRYERIVGTVSKSENRRRTAPVEAI